MSARSLVITGLLLVSCTVVSACTKDSGGPAIRYVALGDSYASGEGNPPFDQGTDVVGPNGDKCHRSAKAYPRVLDVHNEVNLVHRACSGAVIDDILTKAKYPYEPPQVTWVENSTNVVTIMIGGNDAGFPLVELCAVPRVPCPSLEPVIRQRFDSLRTRLPALYAELRRRAPSARLLVVGYPQIFPDPNVVRVDGCGMLNFGGVGISGDDVVWLREKTAQLDDLIRGAALAAGAEYVDVQRAFAGHEVCTHTPWVYGLLPGTARASMHPAASGHKALAARVAAVLTRPPAR